MFTSQGQEWTDPHVIALVELDMQKMRVRFVLTREAISERMRELEHPGTITGMEGQERRFREANTE